MNYIITIYFDPEGKINTFGALFYVLLLYN